MPVTDQAEYKTRRGAPRQVLYGSKSALTTVAGRLYSLGTVAPNAMTAPTTAVVPTSATAGALLQVGSNSDLANPSAVHRVMGIDFTVSGPGRLILIDRASQQGGLDGTTTTVQTTNLPTAALTRWTYCEAGLEISSQIGASSTTGTATFTDDAGNTGQVTPAIAIGNTGFREANRLLLLPVLAGDKGVKAVADWDLVATTGTAGAMGVLLFKRLLTFGFENACTWNWDPLEDFGGHTPEIPNDACLGWLWLAGSTSTGGIEATIAVSED